MRILCGERVLYVDSMNAVAPDGRHVWAQIQPYSYAPETLPDWSAGSYLLTSDGGVVHIGDLAFKVMVDLSAYIGTGRMRYLLQDVARGADDTEGGWEPVQIKEGTVMSQLAHQLGLKSVHMPCCDRTLPNSLRAVKDPGSPKGDIGDLLSGYIYTDGLSFIEIHKALTELLQSLSPDGMHEFIETVYSVLSGNGVPEQKAPVTETEKAGSVPDVPDIPDIEDDAGGSRQEVQAEPDTKSVADNAVQEEKPEILDGGDGRTLADAVGSIASGGSAAELRSRLKIPGGKGIFSSGRVLKGSDITGTDETFTLEYYDKFYKDGLEKADAEGFADRLIKARAGEGVAPVAVLGEAVGRVQKALMAQAESGTDASNLRDQLLDMAEEISKAAEKLSVQN